MTGPTLRRVLCPIDPARATISGADLFARFQEDATLMAIPVVECGRPVGLVDRHGFINHLARPADRALLADKPVGALMDPAPLIVDVGTPLSDLNAIIVTDRPAALNQGFIITQDGHYVGIGTAQSLLAETARCARETDRLTEVNRLLEYERNEEQALNKAKSAFLATMTHELRTPLNAIIGFSEVIESLIGNPHHDASAREYAETIRVSSQHLLDAINSILEYSRLESQQINLDVEPVDLRAMVRSAQRIVDQQHLERGQGVLIDTDRAPPSVRCDERVVRQIIVNLLGNCAKYAKQGAHVTIRAWTDRRGLNIAVMDDGPGIPDDILPKLGQPFSQGDKWTLDRSSSGTGLGLAISRRLAEAHGGSLCIDSTEGIGTTVTLMLPFTIALDDPPAVAAG